MATDYGVAEFGRWLRPATFGDGETDQNKSLNDNSMKLASAPICVETRKSHIVCAQRTGTSRSRSHASWLSTGTTFRFAPANAGKVSVHIEEQVRFAAQKS